MGSSGLPMPGYDCRLLDPEAEQHSDRDTGEAVHPDAFASSVSAAEEVSVGKMGALVCKLPLPPGCLTTLWKNDDRFVQRYVEARCSVA
jgi:acyl-coenzyme A synthetase/AMP-(fatty) acid ligase